MPPCNLLFLLCSLLPGVPLRGQCEPLLEYSGSELTRTLAGRREVIGCTDPEGPGQINGVARSPLGTTYVISDNGIYALSDDVQHLTPLTLRAGAPPGVPHGIQVDERGVLWLATDTAFGSIEPVHLYGHVIAKGAFSALDLVPDGTLRAESQEGVLTYRPGSAAPPVVTLEHADSSPRNGVLRVQLSSMTRGPALYAYRISWRHRYKLQSANEFEITDLEPGRQELMFAVFDQDMRRSQDVRVVVEVPYPKGFSKAVAVPAILASALGLTWILLASARRRGGGRARYTKAVLSALVACVVGLQILAGVIPHARGWPFVGFNMYSHAFGADSYIYKPVMHGVVTNGARIPILPRAAGYVSDGPWQALVPLVYGNDAQRERFLSAYNARHPGHPLVGFVVSDQRFQLTSSGPVAVPPVVMCVYPPGVLGAR